MCTTRRGVLLALSVAFALAAVSAFAQTPATLSISGLVNSPRSFTLAKPQAVPWKTRDEGVAPGAAWIGVGLWTPLNYARGAAASLARVYANGSTNSGSSYFTLPIFVPILKASIRSAGNGLSIARSASLLAGCSPSHAA